jgi:hypothetical protein
MNYWNMFKYMWYTPFTPCLTGIVPKTIQNMQYYKTWNKTITWSNYLVFCMCGTKLRARWNIWMKDSRGAWKFESNCDKSLFCPKYRIASYKTQEAVPVKHCIIFIQNQNFIIWVCYTDIRLIFDFFSRKFDVFQKLNQKNSKPPSLDIKSTSQIHGMANKASIQTEKCLCKFFKKLSVFYNKMVKLT